MNSLAGNRKAAKRNRRSSVWNGIRSRSRIWTVRRNARATERNTSEWMLTFQTKKAGRTASGMRLKAPTVWIGNVLQGKGSRIKRQNAEQKCPALPGRPAASGKRAYGNPCLKRYQQPSENSFLLMQYPAISFLFPKAQETASPLERRSMPFSRESTWDWLTSTERWHLIKRSPSSSCA